MTLASLPLPHAAMKGHAIQVPVSLWALRETNMRQGAGGSGCPGDALARLTGKAAQYSGFRIIAPTETVTGGGLHPGFAPMLPPPVLSACPV